jgi:UDP-N-acetylmuramate dehydrogenase
MVDMSDAISVLQNFSLNEHNTFGLEARAEYYVRCVSEAQVVEALAWAQDKNLPINLLGGGSNVLLAEKISGLVIHIAMLGKGMESHQQEWLVTASAGESWHDFVGWTIAKGAYGLENLSLIPGAVGAAPIQNIGAYGVEVKDCIESVCVWDCLHNCVTALPKSQCNFGYRDSLFKRQPGRYVVISVTFRLQKIFNPELNYAELAKCFDGVDCVTAALVSDAVIALRKSKLPDPKVQPNVGSFFKNPVVSSEQYEALFVRYPDLKGFLQSDGTYKLAAGWLIEYAGWKGKKLGAVGMHDRQALVMVNSDGACLQDVLNLQMQIQEHVIALFGVLLEREPILIGSPIQV